MEQTSHQAPSLATECPPSTGFLPVEFDDQHARRARQIMQRHPEARKLLGTNAWSGLLVAGIVGIQLAASCVSASLPWWGLVLLAYTLGAVANHALWVLVHECTHNLVFKKSTPNRWLAIGANLAMFFPSTVAFAAFHIKHHKYMGQHDHDADLPTRWEAWLLSWPIIGRLQWQIMFPIWQISRTFFLDPRNTPKTWTRWLWVNWVVQLSFVAGWYCLFGWAPLFYMMLSAYFSIGPHPLGARWIQEHYIMEDGQETNSYYGPLNVVALNVGYHNEHHDLPQVPWNRLPELHRLAPEMYQPLYAHHSWVLLWLRFLFDPRMKTLRMVRESTGIDPMDVPPTSARRRVDAPHGSPAPHDRAGVQQRC